MIKSFSDLSEKYPHELHYDNKILPNIIEYKNDLILDLFDTLASICYCDFYNKRNEESYKEITVNIGVVNYDKFNKIEEKFNRLLTFMTNGEIWKIKFYKVDSKKINVSNKQYTLFDTFDSISLLSGGLDALAGASQELKNNTLFVTYSTNGVEESKSKKVFEYIHKANPNCKHVIIPKKQFKRAKHSSQRTRSLIFLGSALLYADHYKVPVIKIYENGIMSLNPTFAFRRKVTKTTHPRTLYYINEILRDLGINIKVINPFAFKTKAEVIDLIPREWNELISMTKTCSKMPGSKAFFNRKDSGICQCGVCTACILRQISILNSNKSGLDSDYINPYNLSSREQIYEYESKNGVKKNKKIIDDVSNYKFVEKNSLRQYYIEFMNRIRNETIFSYLEISPAILEDASEYKKYGDMLNKFALEIEKYLEVQK